MAEYAKKKNDELATLCKDRGLPHTGKKADLVKRLEEHDAQSTAPAATKPAVEDEIDWDDEPAAAETATVTQPAEAAVTSAPTGDTGTATASLPQQSTNNTATDDTTTEAKSGVDEAAGEPKAEEKDFSSGAAMRTLEEEIEKRKKRARKFGMPEDSEEIKALERAKRFGTADLPGLLNKALPDRSEVKKRAADGQGPAEDGGIRKKNRTRGGPGRGRGRKEAGGVSRETAAKTNGSGSWMTDKDREAADRRKARFAAPVN